MRIGLLSPSIYMSPTRHPDMIFAPRELVVSLADGLVAKGHEVYLFTAPDIKTKAKLIPGDEALLMGNIIVEKMKNTDKERFKWANFYSVKRDYELDLTARCYKMASVGKLDIIHSYHDTIAHSLEYLTGFPTVYTLHDPLPSDEHGLFYWLLQKYAKQNYVSISDAYRRHPTLHLNFVATVYHGLNLDPYKPSKEENGYLAFMGRMTPEKGLEAAIAAAAQTEIPIHVATSDLDVNKNIPYFTEKIEPYLTHKNISFVGFMFGEEKNNFLRKARAFLFPIQWEEPFGMVMIEAMSCGTPVIAFNRGSVAEVVKDGVTGFIIDQDNENRPGVGSWIIKKQGVEGLVEAINRIGEIDRSACRKHVEERFTVEKMVEGYEKVYEKIVSSK